MEFAGKWVILLALTSNRGAYDFQHIINSTTGKRLFAEVLEKSFEWGGTPDNMMFVAGATQAVMLADIRKTVPDHFLLVPGVGAQGGSLAEVARYGINRDCGLLVNSSRGIIFASSGHDFAERAAAEAAALAHEMGSLL